MKYTSATSIAKFVGMMSVAEVELMKQIVAKNFGKKSPLVVNIGGNVGTSSIAIMEACPSAFVWSIDKRPCPEEKQNAVDILGGDWARNIVRVLGDSRHVGAYWPVKIDILVIDGDHTEKGCQADFMAWKDKLNPGGIIFFHDYDHPKAPGVSIVVDKIERQYPVFRLGKERYLVAFYVDEEL